MSVSDRLKRARTALKLKQDEMSARTVIPIDTYKKYEGGTRQPGADAIAHFVQAGINANWLLTETGPMLVKDLLLIVNDQVGEYRVSAPAPAPAPAIDMARLQLAIATIEEALEQAHSTASPDGKAQLVAAAYDALRDSDIAHEQVLKLIKLAAQNTAIKQK